MTSPAHQSGGLVTLSGPLFDGRVLPITDVWLSTQMDRVADRAVEIVGEELGAVLVNPTGSYESQIEADVSLGAATSHQVVVHDRGVVYGPWLAGTGSRNAPVTRFKGYNHWRRVAQRLEVEAPKVLIGTLRQLVRKLGG